MNRLSDLTRRYGLDVLIVLAALEAAIEVAFRHDPLREPRSPLWFAVPAVVLVVLPLLGRRRFPFAAPVALWLLAAGLSFVDGRLIVFASGAYVGGIIAAYLLGNHRSAVRARIGLVVVAVGISVVVSNDPNRMLAGLVLTPVLFVIAWLAGYALRERATQAEAAEERALHAERERESAARIAVAEERGRIARELHDIVAHSVSVMVLQVGAVRHGLPQPMTEEKKALSGVEEAGRAALSEMRRLLGAMHDDAQDAERAPQPGLDDLEALVQKVGQAGLPARLIVEGDRIALPRAIDLSVYRIVQEGLTNALKHAQATRADVTVRYGSNELELEVVDDGVGATTSDGLGRGLLGIRERVTIYGGEMNAGDVPGGGFMLSARLPLDRYRT